MKKSVLKIQRKLNLVIFGIVILLLLISWLIFDKVNSDVQEAGLLLENYKMSMQMKIDGIKAKTAEMKLKLEEDSNIK